MHPILDISAGQYDVNDLVFKVSYGSCLSGQFFESLSERALKYGMVWYNVRGPIFTQ